MGSVKVYGPVMSTAVSRVVACLLEMAVPFQLVPINLAQAQHKSPDFLKLQPFGQVPAFQDADGTTLFESRSICRYICNKFPGQGNASLLGDGLVGRARVDQWVEVESQTFNAPISALVFQLVFAPYMGMKQDPAAVQENDAKLQKVLDVYERRLGESRFLAGDEFSLADLCHLPNSHYLVNATEKAELVTSRKNVARWWEEISARESWKKVLDMLNAPSA